MMISFRFPEFLTFNTNPVGSNDQNFTVVNSDGNLNVTAVQTKLAYDPKDVNAGVDPNITAGAYTNDFAGAANPLFYMIDYDLDTFVTISSVTTTNAVVKQKSTAVRINGTPTNARLANGGAVNFRLDGESKGSNAPPVNFALNGTPCNK